MAAEIGTVGIDRANAACVELEADVFEGDLAPLCLVEVEFTSEKDAKGYTPRAWFGADVTEDKRYKNKYMAINGRPS